MKIGQRYVLCEKRWAASPYEVTVLEIGKRSVKLRYASGNASWVWMSELEHHEIVETLPAPQPQEDSNE